MDVAILPDVTQISVQASSQTGKTEVELNLLSYFCATDAGPIMLLEPTFAMCESVSKDRLAPLIRDTEILSRLFGDFRGRRESSNTLLHKKFPGGHLTLSTSQSPSQLASRPIRILLADEIDRFPVSAGGGGSEGEGDPLSLAIKRTITFWNRKLVFVSSPTVKGISRIEREYLKSDQRVFLLPCQHCGAFQELKFERLKYEREDPKNTTRYVCVECQKEWNENLKMELMRLGKWQPRAPFNGNAGFHISELYSPWRRFSDVVEDFLRCEKYEEMLRVFHNTSLGLSFESSLGEVLDWKNVYLSNRSNRYLEGKTILIDDILFATLGADIQADRIELECVGWSSEKNSFSLSYDVLMGDTTQPDVWNQLTDIIQNRSWILKKSGAQIPISLSAIDSGYNTQVVYNFCRKFKSKVVAVKGNPNQRSIVGLPKHVDITLRKGKVASGAKYFPVGVNIAKGELFSWLKLPQPLPSETSPPGYCLFPDHYTENYFKGLVSSEAMVEEIFKGERRIVFNWNQSIRNEPLDARIYARAAAALHGLDRYSKEHWNKLREELGLKIPSQKPEKEDPQEVQPKRKSRKSLLAMN